MTTQMDPKPLGPTGQVVKCLFYLFLTGELVFDIIIYAMSTIFLCSRDYIPEPLLVRDSAALFLSIITLSVIHRGYAAVAHDCAYHLYWFAVVFTAITVTHVAFELFFFRHSLGEWSLNSLTTNDGYNQDNNQYKETESDLELFSEEAVWDDLDKMSFRLPSSDEIEGRRTKLHGKNRTKTVKHVPTQKSKTKTDEEDIKITTIVKTTTESNPITILVNNEKFSGDSFQISNGSNNNHSDSILNKGKATKRAKSDGDVKKHPHKDIPLVLIFHSYSFVLKIICIILAVLTGVLYQMETV